MLSRDIPSLKNRETYYIVDPEKTKDNCDPSNTFAPKVMFVTSPDKGHWGGGKREGVWTVFSRFIQLGLETNSI
jgi:hypothetical protein